MQDLTKNKNIKIIYVSGLCSKRYFNYLFENYNPKPSIAPQKFHYLLASGLAKFCQSIKSISFTPVRLKSDVIKKVKNEYENQISFEYAPFASCSIINSITIFMFTLFKILIYSIKKGNCRVVVICDTLNLSQSAATVFASFILKIKIVALATDLPINQEISSFKMKHLPTLFYSKILFFLFKKYHAYILLTEHMKKFIHDKPFIVMEGLVQLSTNNNIFKKIKGNKKRIIIYAGGLYKVYGIEILIHAFLNLKFEDIELHFYGTGDMIDKIKTYMNNDNRIQYMGVISNDKISEIFNEAYLLVNPRFSNAEYTLYSFPSKNIEFMTSGTPLVTTRLKGIPNEYFNYCFVFESETVEGISKTLNTLLLKEPVELLNFGIKAKQFVLQNKNNIIQAERIYNFILN
jgi:glycosyltransferase involved in cell wall biosynthesis